MVLIKVYLILFLFRPIDHLKNPDLKIKNKTLIFFYFMPPPHSVKMAHNWLKYHKIKKGPLGPLKRGSGIQDSSPKTDQRFNIQMANRPGFGN